MRKRSYTIRAMTRQEVDIPINWAAEEGWNPGVYDANCFHAADPNGFLIGMLGDEPVATVSVVKYGKSYGFLGFYIVKPGYRGMGYGIQIWNAGLAYLSGRMIGLDGVMDQQDNYRKSGFTLSHQNIRYLGSGGGILPVAPEIVQLSTISFEDICAYDKPFFPDERTQFLQCWINQPESIALGILQDRTLKAYGVLRPCRSGHKIGPLFADSLELADRLFLALKAHAPTGSPIYMDIPAVNVAAVELAKRHSLTATFETARMYKGEIPKLPMNRFFGVTTFELG